LDFNFASLLDQDLPEDNYEIICVDDGSKDGSGELLDKYANEHTNIKVIHQANAGHANARNAGMDIAQGKYIWFVDADDCIDRQCVGFIVDSMESHDIGVMSIRHALFHNDNEVPTTPFRYKYAPNAKQNPSPCSGIRIFNLELLKTNNIRWRPELGASDDLIFCFFAETYAKNVVYIDSVSYYHRKWSGSVTGRKDLGTDKRFIDSHIMSANIFKNELSNPRYAKKQIKNLKLRIRHCAQAILTMTAMIGDKEFTKETLKTLQEQGLYPYAFIGSNLLLHISFKRTMLDWSIFLFPIKIYYKLYCAVFRKFHLTHKY
jgi:glycosyltransferase involved in cell wall biosynthesis